MGLLTNNKLLTETENIAPKKKPEQPAKQERSAAEKSRNDKRYRARFTPVKKKENAQKAVLKPVQERSDRAERAERQERSERPGALQARQRPAHLAEEAAQGGSLCSREVHGTRRT